MKKQPTITDQAIRDALLAPGDSAALERLRAEASHDPALAARLAEWSRVIRPGARERERAQQAHARVAQGVARRLDQRAVLAVAEPPRAGAIARRPLAWGLAAAAGLLIILAGAVVFKAQTPGTHQSTQATVAVASHPATPAPAVQTKTITGSRDVADVIRQAERGETLVVKPGPITGPVRIAKPLRIVASNHPHIID